MKKTFKTFAALAMIALTAVSCSTNSGNGGPDPTEDQYVLSGDITADKTLQAGLPWKLSGFVYVRNGATLTVEPGTVIKGISGSKAALIVERGAKLMAEGTASKPIVFTSDKAPGSRGYGDWGGVVLCGKASTNKVYNGQNGVGQCEGGIESLFGGGSNPNDEDNSGVIKYVRIEFAGIPLTAVANSEINGLTLYAIGRGTTVSHVQVSYCGDDSYEWFGGTVNCDHLVALRTWDDDFDTDNGFSGSVQFAVALRHSLSADQSDSNGFESDNDADGSSLTPLTSPVFSNISIFGPLATQGDDGLNSQFKAAMHIRRNSSLSVYNSLFVGFPVGLTLDSEKGTNSGGKKGVYANVANGTLNIKNVIMSGMTANFAAYKSAQASDAADSQAVFETAANNNLIKTLSELGMNIPMSSSKNRPAMDLLNPDFLPNAGSILVAAGSGSFSDDYIQERKANLDLDETATYIGAFNATDWTEGWAEWDPVNAAY